MLINYAISKVREVYGVEVFDDSHIEQSPNFRRNRKTELKLNYEWASVALRGRRGKEGSRVWSGLDKPNGEEVQIVPFAYNLNLTKSGLSLDFSFRLYRVSVQSNRKFLQFHKKFEGKIHTLCYRSRILPELGWNDECDPFATFGENVALMLDSDSYTYFDFSRFDIGFPIDKIELESIVESFVYFYPIYDSYIQIAKGEKVRFKQLIKRLNKWYIEQSESNDTEKVSNKNISFLYLEKAQALADQKIKVMPAIRWQVFQRDGWKCVACGRNAANDEVILHVDHIQPRSKGGKDTLGNYQTLCSVCNIGKSNRDNTDLRRQV